MDLFTILLADANKEIRTLLRTSLEQENFIILEASKTQRMIDILACHHIDLILLEQELQDGTTLPFLPRIRSQTDAPVIMMSGQSHSAHKVKLFEMGADDVINKPFEMPELFARIKANLRRGRVAEQREINDNAKTTALPRIRFNDWILDKTRFGVFKTSGQSADLTAQEFQLLDILVQHPHQVFLREELCLLLKEQNYIPTERSIDVKIARIRRKLGDDARDSSLIKTVHRLGYMLNCPTQTLSHIPERTIL